MEAVDFEEVVGQLLGCGPGVPRRPRLGRGARVPGRVAARAPSPGAARRSSEVVAPAVALADEGVRSTSSTPTVLRILEPILTRTPEAAAIVAARRVDCLGAGDRLHNPELARVPRPARRRRRLRRRRRSPARIDDGDGGRAVGS